MEPKDAGKKRNAATETQREVEDLIKKNPHNSKTSALGKVLGMEEATADSNITNGDSRTSSKGSPWLTAVSSCSISLSSSDSDGKHFKDGGEIRNVTAAPSSNTTVMETKVKRSKPSTLF